MRTVSVYVLLVPCAISLKRKRLHCYRHQCTRFSKQSRNGKATLIVTTTAIMIVNKTTITFTFRFSLFALAELIVLVAASTVPLCLCSKCSIDLRPSGGLWLHRLYCLGGYRDDQCQRGYTPRLLTMSRRILWQNFYILRRITCPPKGSSDVCVDELFAMFRASNKIDLSSWFVFVATYRHDWPHPQHANASKVAHVSTHPPHPLHCFVHVRILLEVENGMRNSLTKNYHTTLAPLADFKAMDRV